MPNTLKTCPNGHTSNVPIAKLTCHCGAGYPQYVNLFKVKTEVKIKCANPLCRTVFTKVGRQKYCSKNCRQEHHYAKNRNSEYPDLVTGTIGASGDLGVTADLLKRGYDVFKSVSPACWTDLVVYANGRFQSVEVKVGSRTTTGRLIYGKPRTKTDIIAVLLPDEIIYKPPFD